MKEGIYTSEFWLGLITVILTYLNSALDLHIPVEAIAGLAAVAISYIFSRTYLKSKAIQQPPVKAEKPPVAATQPKVVTPAPAVPQVTSPIATSNPTPNAEQGTEVVM